MSDFNWTDEVIIRFRTLWDEGHPTREIGRRLGVSHNAVVGKARRLDFPPRPDPIIRDGIRKRPKPIRVHGPTLPPLASTQPPPVVLLPKAPPQPKPVQQAPKGRVKPCEWPIGEPASTGFHFCGAESVPGKPYCSEHCQLAYVPAPKPDRRHADAG